VDVIAESSEHCQNDVISQHFDRRVEKQINKIRIYE
jgi:hypothetical protein